MEYAVSELGRSLHTLLVPGFVGTTAPDWLRRRIDLGLGGVALFARNITSITQCRALTDDLHGRAPHLLIAVDEEGGDVTRLESRRGSRHLGARALGAIDDMELTRQVGASIGGLLRQAGIDWNWSPVADVSNNPDNPVIGVRSYGADPSLVARHSAAMVRGLQDDAAIVACAKHFPGHGNTNVDSHLDLPVVGGSRLDLDAIELVPFRACIEVGVRSIMTGHLRVLALDPELPATISRVAITRLLREELGFTGVVVSDALEMAGVAQLYGIEEAAVLAVQAGVDALCLGGELADEGVVDRVHAALVNAVRTGRLAESRIHDAAHRLADLTQWRATHSQHVPPVMTDTRCRAAATRALSTQGQIGLGDQGVLVLECQPTPGIAAGPVAWGLSEVFLAASPNSTVVTLDEHAAVPTEVMNSRGLVLVLHDAARHRWQRDFERQVLSRRPDAVVVELGVPTEPQLPAAGRIVSHGSSRSSVEAVVSLLTSTPERTAP